MLMHKLKWYTVEGLLAVTQLRIFYLPVYN
jgi:hypothetical protein